MVSADTLRCALPLFYPAPDGHSVGYAALRRRIRPRPKGPLPRSTQVDGKGTGEIPKLMSATARSPVTGVKSTEYAVPTNATPAGV
jgi:hypothetical protein